MSKIGQLFEDREGRIYILLKTRLGFIALDVGRTGGTFGGLQRDMDSCLSGLRPTGYYIDMVKSQERKHK